MFSQRTTFYPHRRNNDFGSFSTPSASPASPPMRTQGPNRSFWNTTRPTSANPPLFRSEPCIAECLRQKEDRAQPETLSSLLKGNERLGDFTLKASGCHPIWRRYAGAATGFLLPTCSTLHKLKQQSQTCSLLIEGVGQDTLRNLRPRKAPARRDHINARKTATNLREQFKA